MTGAWGPAPLGPEPASSEESLLRRARAGERAAVERLYADHVGSARRLATILAGAGDAEELVSESFARVLAQLRAGGGPTTSFRAYLNTTIRNLHRDQFRRNREEPASDRPWLLDESESPIDELVDGLDANGATAALASLPGSWQQILWHLEVEGRKPAEVAVLLSTNAAAVSSLAYRAREGLRRAYLDQYAGPAPVDAGCRRIRRRLSQYVRDDLSRIASGKVASHLGTCSACSAAYSGMAELNTKLAASLFPIVLVGGMAALDKVAGAGAAGASAPLVAELTARAAGTPVTQAAPAAAGGGPGGGGRVSTRATALVGATVVAVLAITATTFALTRDEGEQPRAARDTAETIEVEADITTPSVLPTPTPQPTSPALPTPSSSDPAFVPTTPVGGTLGVTSVPTVPTPTVPTSTSTLPVIPPLPPPTPTSPPQTVPEPQLTKVHPVAPTATPITRCGSYGSLRIPRTIGVRYTQVAGDGREGDWTVAASAVPGYAIARGAPRRFTGDLGRFHECPVTLAIREVISTASGDAVQLTVATRVPDGERRALTVTYWFDSPVTVVRHTGDGWTCRAIDARVRCAYESRGQQPPPLSLVVRAPVAPSGSVTLSADGDVVDAEDFDSVDR